VPFNPKKMTGSENKSLLSAERLLVVFAVASIATGIITLSIAGYGLPLGTGLLGGTDDASQPVAESGVINSFTWNATTCENGDGYIRVTDMNPDVGRQLVINRSQQTQTLPTTIDTHLYQQNGHYVLDIQPQVTDTSQCQIITYRAVVQLPNQTDTLEIKYNDTTKFVVHENGVGGYTNATEPDL
jgi:hypothetical protein